MDRFSFRRDLPEGKYKLNDIFTGLEEAPELKEVFGSDIEKLKEVFVVITGVIKMDQPPHLDGKLEYAYINNGEIHIGTDYIRSGPEQYIYLDMIHELVHIKQHWEGRELFDKRYTYVARPTEIEAYQVCTAAAKRIGMSVDEICKYLAVPWASKEEMARLEKTLKLK